MLYKYINEPGYQLHHIMILPKFSVIYFDKGDDMEQLIMKIGILIVIVVGIIYIAISFLPLFALKENVEKDDDDE